MICLNSVIEFIIWSNTINFVILQSAPVESIGEGWRPYKGQKDIYGQEIEDRIYNNKDYDYNIILF
mgnify:CR=1 FL=1